MFKWLQITRPGTLTDIQRAARFYYLQQSALGGRVDGQTYGTATTTSPGLNLLRSEETLSAAHLGWQEVMKKYDREHTLFYCDPPYWQTRG